MHSKRYTETSDAIGFEQPIELHDIYKKSARGYSATASDLIKGTTIDAAKWLPFASEKYNISADIKDYVVVPVTIMPSDLPNRNGVAFPHSELTSFSVDTGMVSYQTWAHKPTFVEHNNQDHTQAKGVIFDVAYRKMPHTSGDLWKVVVLTGWDRTRDCVLANEILTKRRQSYSMGAYVSDYACSICGARQTNGGCDHVTLGSPEFKTFPTKDGDKLAYLRTIDVCGFETSSVAVPAYISATS
jgi:hypothetical protein